VLFCMAGQVLCPKWVISGPCTVDQGRPLHSLKADMLGVASDVRFSNRPVGVKHVRLSTTAVSMSLTGSCFSSESAPGHFHHGIRERGGTISVAALPSNDNRSKGVVTHAWQFEPQKRTLTLSA